MLSAVVLATMAIGANAQTQKGYYLIGGNVGSIGGTFQGGGSEFNLSITPKAAWFIQDNLAVGGYVNLGLNTIKDGGTVIDYGVGPMARYYFGNKQMEDANINAPKQVRFFGEAHAGLGGRSLSKGGGSTTGFDGGIGPGVAFFVNENIALEALAKLNVKTGFGSSAVAFSPNIGVGFQIYLPGSKLRSLRNEVK